jgi:type II secretory pathway pseudopilin PulG
MRAQTAIEYFIIAGMVLMFMVPIWAYIVTTQQQTTQQLSLTYARNAAKQIADAASLVHSQGSPAKINIKVFIPSSIKNVSIYNKTIVFQVITGPQTAEIWYTSTADMQGEEKIPVNEGYYYFDIISHDTYVEINRTV